MMVLLHGNDLRDLRPDADLGSLLGNVPRPSRILGSFDVTAKSHEEAQTFEIKVPALAANKLRVLVAINKSRPDQPPSTLWINWFRLDGPLNTLPKSHRRLLNVAPDLPSERQTHDILSRFLSRAYRRPVSSDELARSIALVNGVVADGNKWEAGIQFAMQAALCSPKFLFRVELDDRLSRPEASSLSEFPLASRLSYFLWSSMPDDELLGLAERNELSANLDTQVRRMLADPKSEALVENFALQWLQLRCLDFFEPDGELFPKFDNKLRGAMLRETAMFFGSILREDRSVLELIDADYTFLNNALADHYGIRERNSGGFGEPIKFNGGEFQRVSLLDRRRGGLLTQASVLTVTSNPTRTSPVKRGRWVLEQILGTPPPSPPPDVPELEETGENTHAASLRARLEEHRKNPSCANCHAKMDPIGFALENYNAIGAFRTRDGEFDVDASGEFADGTKFSGPEGLKSIILGRKDAFVRCLTEKLLIYALGRGLEYYDRRAVDRIARALTENDCKFSVLVSEIVQSDPFRMRRGYRVAGF
jgi:hypothetical protein